jgi:hypothetical protein
MEDEIMIMAFMGYELFSKPAILWVGGDTDNGMHFG